MVPSQSLTDSSSQSVSVESDFWITWRESPSSPLKSKSVVLSLGRHRRQSPQRTMKHLATWFCMSWKWSRSVSLETIGSSCPEGSSILRRALEGSSQLQRRLWCLSLFQSECCWSQLAFGCVNWVAENYFTLPLVSLRCQTYFTHC